MNITELYIFQAYSYIFKKITIALYKPRTLFCYSLKFQIILMLKTQH